MSAHTNEIGELPSVPKSRRLGCNCGARSGPLSGSEEIGKRSRGESMAHPVDQAQHRHISSCLEDEVPEDQVPTAAAATQAPPNLPTKTEAALQAPAPTPTAHPLQGRTPLADTSMQALVVLRQHWAGLKGKLHARKVRMQQDPKHLQKLSAVDRWDHLVLWKWKQREFANYTDLLKLLKRDRDSEQLTSQLPAKTRPKK